MKKNYCILFFNLLIYSLASSQCTPTLFKDGINSFGRAEVNNSLLLFTYEGVWKSDGTPNGTQLINGSPRINNGAFGFATLNNVVYFSAYSPSYNVSDLWKTDGTEAGTVLVTSIPNANGIKELVVLQDKLFFIVKKGFGNEKIWVSDGTAAGTNQFIDLDPTNDINLCPKELLVYNNQLYFWAGDGSTYFQHYYKTDGTAAGTIILNDIGDEYGYNLGGYSVISNEKLFYFTGSNSGNQGLWVTDGTSGGTNLVKPLLYLDNLVDVNGILYFNGTDNDGSGGSLYGGEPWKSDGTTSGTSMIKDIAVGTSSSMIGSSSYFFKFGNKVLFAASDGVSGTELWETDGTSSGTQILKDIYVGASGVNNFPGGLDYNGTFYFGANDGSTGNELWKTDGTTAGTMLVADLTPGIEGSNPSDLFVFHGRMFFETSGNFEEKLWYCGDLTASVEEMATRGINLFPNPSNGLINVTNNEGVIGKIDIYNSIGLKVLTSDYSSENQTRIDMSHFSKGIYLARFRNDKNELFLKFILE